MISPSTGVTLIDNGRLTTDQKEDLIRKLTEMRNKLARRTLASKILEVTLLETTPIQYKEYSELKLKQINDRIEQRVIALLNTAAVNSPAFRQHISNFTSAGQVFFDTETHELLLKCHYCFDLLQSGNYPAPVYRFTTEDYFALFPQDKLLAGIGMNPFLNTLIRNINRHK